VRWWYQRVHAWWRSLKASQWTAAPGGPGQQAGDLGGGQRDHAGIGGRRLAGPDRGRRLGIGALPELGGGDGADGQGHDQDGVPGDRGVEADLGLIQAEEVLPGPELLLHRSPEPGRPDQPGQRHLLPFWHEAVVSRQLASLEVAADEQVVLRGSGSQPGPAVPAPAPGSLPGGADLAQPAASQLAGRVRAG
jgi:hypothetical protein